MKYSTMKRVNAGVIGVETMGQHHARVYDELPGVDLVGVVDCETEKATAIASEHDTQVMSHSALLDTADVVSIAVPTSYHHETALTCIDHGVDILIEKPVVREPDNGKLLISRSQQENVTVQVGHIERFNPAIRTVFDIIPEINIKTITARRLSSPSDRLIEDSATLDLMIHDIDIILSIVDSSIEVATAFGSRESIHFSPAPIQQRYCSRSHR